jgi:hypothetical protein
MDSFKQKEVANAIINSIQYIEQDLKKFSYNDNRCHDQLLEIKQDVKDMQEELHQVYYHLTKSLDLIDRIADDHLYQLSVKPEKHRKFRIVK